MRALFLLITLTIFSFGNKAKTYHWRDDSRGRLIPVRIYPQKKDLPANHLIIINGGYRSTPEDYDFIAKNFSTSNCLVVSIQYDLEGDPVMAFTGNIYEQRLPVWKEGVKTLSYVLQKIDSLYPKYKDIKPILIGHSNGGDIATLYTSLYPGQVEALITLDHRRMPLPRISNPRILSLRAGEFQADSGVLPDMEEEKLYALKIITYQQAKHGDFDNSGSKVFHQQFLKDIRNFLDFI